MNTLSPKNLNRTLLFKLPSAFICGVRAKLITDQKCEVTVTHKWINQNPFGSMYFAVEAMAAELSTAGLLLNHIQLSNKNILILVAENNAKFYKKATGTITFVCNDGDLIKQMIEDSIHSGESQKFWVNSKGYNLENELVAEMSFCWSIKYKS